MSKFHPFALAICHDETSDDFAFIFDALYQFNTQWRPTILLADSAEAITNGFVQVFGHSEVRINCFYHVCKNIEKYVKVITKGGKNADVVGDLLALQSAKDDDTFPAASRIFIKKYRAVSCEFADYFESQCLQKNSQWYEGAAIGLPSTNNGLEATNRVIKDEHSLR